MKSKKFALRVAIGCYLALTFSDGLLSQDAVKPTRLGLDLMDQGRCQEAEAFLRQALEIAGLANATAVYNLASLYHRQGRLPEAERLQRLALEQIERTRGPFAPEMVQSLSDLGALYRSLGRYTRAIDVLERAVQILDRNPPQKFTATVLLHLANTYYDLGEYAEADSLVRRALAAFEAGNYEDPSDLGYILSGLGRGYALREQYVDAEAAYHQAVSVIGDTLGPRRSEYALALANLAFVYERTGRFRDALPVFESAIDILEQSVGDEAPFLAEVLYGYSNVIKALGRKSEARQIARRAKSMEAPRPGTVDIRALSRR
ncbi:MAG: tetratricopeptide repeat protein [Bryobacteraceae bacterium]|nr:tetratricopeptide repeat protein [Bryobacteraceae bacterium]